MAGARDEFKSKRDDRDLRSEDLIGLAREGVRLLRDVRELFLDLIWTTRFARGNYDGPYLDGRTHDVGAQPVEVYSNRGHPGAIVFYVEQGTGNISDVLYVGDDPQRARGGYRVAIDRPAAMRILADSHQTLYAAAQLANGGTIAVRVVEGRA